VRGSVFVRRAGLWQYPGDASRPCRARRVARPTLPGRNFRGQVERGGACLVARGYR